ncbi:MAG: DNRLRE domain-containing protein, partial [Phycisphaerae bacterium]
NWQGTGTNQLNGAAVSRPFFSATGAAFFGDLGASTSPAALDYTKLPKVTFVIPNLDSDMHDGAYPTNITTGDTWLQTNINAYAQWARTHNSLLVVTFDEDNSSGAQANKIPTIFYGANLKPGGTTVDATYTLHNLLRTVEDTYGATHSGAAAKVRAVHGAFAADVGTGTARLQQGNGYADAHDTMLQSDQPTTKGNALADLTVDTASTTGGVNQVLIRFDNLAAKVPAGAQILSAKLIVKATNTSANNTTLHRLTHAWTDNATWNDVDGNGVADAAGGVDLGGADAETNVAFTLDAPYTGNMAIFDVTGSVEAWLAGAATNFGWALLPTGSDGFAFTSSEGTAADRPVLEIVYVPEPGTAAGVACAAAAASLRRRRRH